MCVKTSNFMFRLTKVPVSFSNIQYVTVRKRHKNLGTDRTLPFSTPGPLSLNSRPSKMTLRRVVSPDSTQILPDPRWGPEGRVLSKRFRFRRNLW